MNTHLAVHRVPATAESGAGTPHAPQGRAREQRSPHGVEALVARAASGDTAAWDELVERFGRLVWSVTRAHRLPDADAADVFQTTWLRLVENIDRIAQPGSLGGWLATTARRESLAVLRRNARILPTDDP